MNIEIQPAKDGNLTCKINSVYLHSAYSPLKESERFVSSIQSPFIPEIIFIIEPGLSYCVQYLREKFPHSKLAVIRLIKDLETYNKDFDYSFSLYNYTSADDFFSQLFNDFGENILAFSLIVTWEPSAKIFNDEVLTLYKGYKNLIEKSHSVLRTRSFFEKRWIKNSLNIALQAKKTGLLKEKGNCPVLILASGPSLKSILPFIKNKNPYIIAVSSALRPLHDAGIFPDIVISTDGGYWAKKHLETEITNKTILALAVEGNVPSEKLLNSRIIPLIYPDGIESEIFKKSSKNYMTALRCGTVSGTALEFAKQITSGPIYFSGLDLSVSNGFQHTQNNNLELINCIYDNKIASKEKRLCSQSFSNQKISLKIYEDWFANQKKLNENVFRIIENSKNKLGNIKDISTEDFKKIDFSGKRPDFIFSNVEAQEEIIEDFIKVESCKKEWLQNVFTTEYLNYAHTYDENIKENLYEKITKSNSDFLENLCRVFTKK